MADRIVVTVIGEDKTGIVASISKKLSESRLNIVDITQKVFENNIFAMVMLVKTEEYSDIRKLQEDFKILEENLGVKIFLQHEEIFKTMHRI